MVCEEKKMTLPRIFITKGGSEFTAYPEFTGCQSRRVNERTGNKGSQCAGFSMLEMTALEVGNVGTLPHK
jgi:hypothetical protein